MEGIRIGSGPTARCDLTETESLSHNQARQQVDRPRLSPNILFVLSDQQRWDTVGCYGQEMDVTPNLDAMAAEGVRFGRPFTSQPLPLARCRTDCVRIQATTGTQKPA
jgi:hypothetical protein